MAQLDIRINVNFLDHPKTKRIQSKIGENGIICLIRLWCWCARFRPRGKLFDLTAEEIEDAAGWRGNSKALLACLLLCGFMDETQEGFQLHDWEEHNGWIYGSERRSSIARKNITKRWAGNTDANTDANTNANTNANTPSPSPSPYPSPSPSPSPTLGNTTAPGNGSGAAALPIEKPKNACSFGTCVKKGSIKSGKDWFCPEHIDVDSDVLRKTLEDVFKKIPLSEGKTQ